ncbi:MAG: cell wall metabolism sensor histidine kinase WalK [Lachnospiraceae bacterium]|nr:cell wall metabolism sensor histidine kinase WalK [Lachnospiraceae bacterium]
MIKKLFDRFNNIFFRVFTTFAILILIFAVVLGIIFVQLNRNAAQQYNEASLSRMAQTIATRFRNYLMDNDYEECMAYLGMFGEIETTELWTVSNPNAAEPMSEIYANMGSKDIFIQPEFADIIKAAFKGESESGLFYSNLHGMTAMAVGMPVSINGRENCGAIVLVRTMDQLDDTTSSSIRMIFISSLLALGVSGLVAAMLARRITEPVRQMKEMAKDMAEGNYECKTGIDRTDEIGEMARSIDVLSDKLLENEVERANLEQMRLDFFANVSHELRTPISVVRATAECLNDGVVTDAEKVGLYYERILRECKTMERLVADLLTLSKMQNPNFKIEKEPVNLVEVFGDIIRNAAAISNEKNITIKVHRDKDVYMMMGDYDRLKQMFMVIFDNAVKFSPEGSNVYVDIHSDEDKHIVVTISDEGVGITPEELPFIFEKFYRSKLRMNAKGSGLGLPIAKYIAAKHDGTIDVKSEQGVGTEFTFSFEEAFEGQDTSGKSQ